MANRLVSVDDNLNLPPAVKEQLVSSVRSEFQGNLTASQAAATSASTSATNAATSASAAQAAASSVTVPTNAQVDARITNAINTGQIYSAAQTRDLTTDVSATVRVVYESTYWYTVIKVNTNGVTVPGLVKRQFPNDYETTGTTNANFKPPRINLNEFYPYKNRGYDIIFNVSGWQVTGNVGEIVGLQIKDGVMYHNFAASNAQQGTDVLGFKADGTSAIYSARFGDTGASVLAAGVVDTFGFGPALVINGTTQNLEANSQWGSFNTENSGRQILGVSSTGDIIIITVYGATGVSGIKGNAVAALAAANGCHNAIMLDGGGSAQTYINGKYGNFSSDAGLQRPVPDFGVIRCRVVNEFDTGWRTLPPASGFTSAEAGRIGQIRRRGESLTIRGRFTGSVGTAYTTVANIPVEFVSPQGAAYVGAAGAPANATSTIVSVVPGDSAIQARATTAAAYLDLTGMNYDQI